MPKSFWLPTRPFNVIAAINRVAASTGSFRYAMQAQVADYNGHRVDFVEPNKFKPYWTCFYTWAGICTIGRGSLADCLRAARREYDRGALGACSRIVVDSDDDAQTCIDAGFQPHSPEIESAHNASWWTPLHNLINDAFDCERHGLVPHAVSILANSKTAEEYTGKIQAYLDERRAARKAVR